MDSLSTLTNADYLSDNSKFLEVGKIIEFDSMGYPTIKIGCEKICKLVNYSYNLANPQNKFITINNIESFNLFLGDILFIKDNRIISIPYKANYESNSLFLTGQCDQRCIMCSQPPTILNDLDYFYDHNIKIIDLIPIDCKVIGITGGEPTLQGDRMIHLLKMINSKLPETTIHLLTNARAFSNKKFSFQLVNQNIENILFSIPLHADNAFTHDKITQVKDSFYKTLAGIYNLAYYNQKIEIRIILQKSNINRLLQISKYISKNLPFVCGICFVGLENIGCAIKNKNTVWINIEDYSEILKDSVEYLSSAGYYVSIFNIPLCLLDERIRPFAKDSISEWKKIYLDECTGCSLKNECPGLFIFNKKMHLSIKKIEVVDYYK